MSGYPSAPLGYALLLHARNNWLRLVAAHAQRGAHRKPAPLQGSQGLVLSPVTGLAVPERVVPGELSAQLLAEHAARYLWALQRVENKAIVDLGCGSGYGSYLLSWAAAGVIAVDRSESALAFARAHYPGVEFRAADLTRTDSLPQGELAVCFEVLEHLPELQGTLHKMLQRYPRLLLSFPNPWWHNSGLNPHHLNDWPLSKLKSQLRAAGASRIQLFQQRHGEHTVRAGASVRSSVWLLDARRQDHPD